jgi:hypothetical protein
VTDGGCIRVRGPCRTGGSASVRGHDSARPAVAHPCARHDGAGAQCIRAHEDGAVAHGGTRTGAGDFFCSRGSSRLPLMDPTVEISKVRVPPPKLKPGICRFRCPFCAEVGGEWGPR